VQKRTTGGDSEWTGEGSPKEHSGREKGLEKKKRRPQKIKRGGVENWRRVRGSGRTYFSSAKKGYWLRKGGQEKGASGRQLRKSL